MATKGFGAKEINVSGEVGTPTIESDGNLNINAVNVAISTNVTIGGTVNSNITVGTGYTFHGDGAGITGMIGVATVVSIFSGLIQEDFNLVTDSLDDQLDINLNNGMVHLFNDANNAVCSPNIISNNGINTDLAVGKAISVMVISKQDNSSYYANHVKIDHADVVEEWLCGVTPTTGGTSGYDIYTYNIMKTGDAAFTVFANQVNYTN
tara:strand:+ start:8655 stop:9278 length:624 start_codon:yes stop_codon:yes gene_type:complete